MSFVRKIKRGNSVYYAEVENKRVGGKVVQRHIRYLGKDPNAPHAPPKKAEINDVGFSYLATMLMQKALTANDVFEFLEDQGIMVSREELEKIGLFYDFGKKTFSVYLSYQKTSKRKPAAGDAGSR
ncbi:MAG TPA: hypothetical protein ENH28_00850 [Euryarchaeota archaeon]|nr:hypothetical protein BMS3Bbin15_00024 [archaeon BMS3Bbin15]HDL14700.1 hypothetical protein [Euryarchaeota archaeon]